MKYTILLFHQMAMIMTKREFVKQILSGKRIDEILPPMFSWMVNQYETFEELKKAIKEESGADVIKYNGKYYKVGGRKPIGWFQYAPEEDE